MHRFLRGQFTDFFQRPPAAACVEDEERLGIEGLLQIVAGLEIEVVTRLQLRLDVHFDRLQGIACDPAKEGHVEVNALSQHHRLPEARIQNRGFFPTYVVHAGEEGDDRENGHSGRNQTLHAGRELLPVEKRRMLALPPGCVKPLAGHTIRPGARV